MTSALQIRHSIKRALYAGTAELPRMLGVTALRRLPLRENSLRVLMYHKVSDEWPNVISVGTSLFRKQQEYLAENYNVISLDQLASHFDFGTPLPDKAVLLTFDDGYVSAFKYAYPILKVLRHPAVIFVPTDYIGGGILAQDLVLSKPETVLAWEELRAIRDVFEIGSHGCSHTILTRLKPKDIERELVESRRFLEHGLGGVVRAFAYPNGDFGDFDQETETIAKRAGYTFCFTTIHGTNLRPTSRFRLKRYNVEDFGLRYFKSLLDGSTDLVQFKSTALGVSLKTLVNRTLGLA